MLTPALNTAPFVRFLRADSVVLHGWMTRQGRSMVWTSLAFILVGSGLYGAVIGSWWTPLQAVYAAIKLPLLILLTTLGNGLLNGMLAPLLGLRPFIWDQSGPVQFIGPNCFQGSLFETVYEGMRRVLAI